MEKFQAIAKELAEALEAQWDAAKLRTEFDIFGMRWTRAFALTVLIRHMIHHRAQIQVLMRQAGLKVPGVYGPSRDEPRLPEVAKA